MNPKRIQPLFVALLIALPSCGGKESTSEAMDIHTVSRTDLRITVREQGEIQAARNTRIASKLEGRATLIMLVEEGKMVQEGEQLAELDVSGIEDKLSNQAISVAKAEAALDQAKKNFEIMEKGFVASEEAARSTLTIAGMRRDKFIGQTEDARQTTNGSSTAGTNAAMVEKLQELLDTEFSTNATAEVNYSGLVTHVMDILGDDENLLLEMGEMATQILRKIETIRPINAGPARCRRSVRRATPGASSVGSTNTGLKRRTLSFKSTRRRCASASKSWNIRMPRSNTGWDRPTF